jgi:hypothetical protein
MLVECMNLKKIGKVFTSKFVGTGPSSYEKKRIYRAAVSQRFRNTALECLASIRVNFCHFALCSDKACSCLTLNTKLLQPDIRTDRDINSRIYNAEACFMLPTNNHNDVHAFTVNQRLSWADLLLTYA